MLRRNAFLPCVLLLVPVAATRAGTFTVDPNGRGDYTGLQDAIDAVPPGSTLIVLGTHLPAVIDGKPLALVGGVIDWDPASNPPANATGLEVKNCAWLYLQDMVIGHGAPTYQPGQGAHGLAAQGVGRLMAVNCKFLGTPSVPGSLGDCAADGPFHGAWVNGSGVAVFQTCSFAGADGKSVWAFDTGCTAACDPVRAGDGGDGLNVVASLALVEGGTALGGLGGDAHWNPVSCPACDYAPQDLRAGDGGHGVSGPYFGTAINLGGGAGGLHVYYCTDWGIGSDGSPGGPDDGQRTLLPDVLTLTPLAQPGAAATLQGSGLQQNAPVLLFAQVALLSAPVRFKQGWWFLGFPFFKLGTVQTDAFGRFTLQGTVPGDPALIGTFVFVQAVDPATLSEVAALAVACQ